MQKLKNNYKNSSLGFTLVELLVVISILGVLATIGLVSFISAQARGRDTQRKSDLKEVATSLELYFSDYGVYPSSNAGSIMGCPTPAGVCSWGSGEFTDGKTLYFKVLPVDPVSTDKYYYRTVTVNSVANSGFQLFARLENSQDINCLAGTLGKSSCTAPANIPNNVNCGAGGSCNFAVTSANVTATQ